jgi:hypothetical protein
MMMFLVVMVAVNKRMAGQMKRRKQAGSDKDGEE